MSDNIEISFWGKTEKITAGSTVLEVVQRHALKEPFAIAVNKVLVTKAEYDKKTLQNGDVVDVVCPMQGG